MRKLSFVLAIVLAIISVGSAGAETAPSPETRFVDLFRPDPTLGEIRVIVEPALFTPLAAVVDDAGKAKPVTQTIDARGVRTSFITNEIVLSPRDEAELRAVVDALGAEIVADDSIPPPPAEIRNARRDMDPRARTYVLRVDSSNFSREDLPELMRDAGASGDVQLSDEAGARLLAEVLRLRKERIIASINIVLGLDFGRDKAIENAGGDFFTEAAFASGPGLTSVTRAWQLMFAAGITPSVTVAMIDRGFWLVNTVPGDLGGILDLGVSSQFDFIDDDGDAGGADEGGGFHGYNTTSVAVAAANNSAGAAGAGGFVASRPLLFRAYSTTEVERAIRRATSLGADVISISLGGGCNTICDIGNFFSSYWDIQKVDLIGAVGEATRAGVVVVASAGNDGENVDDVDYLPCVVVTICVGATAGNSGQPWPSSNYGGSVSLFAPTPVTALRGGSTMPGLVSFNGTSASAPIVSGTVAMMRSANAAASPVQLTAMLLNSAWTQNPPAGGRVGRWLNAYEAVLAAFGGRIPDDSSEVGDNPAQPRAFALSSNGSGGLAGAVRNATLRNRFDTDAYRITIPDYRAVTVSLHFMRSLNPTRLEVRPNVALDPEPFDQTFDSDVTRQASLLAPPGTYDLIVTGGGPQLYDLEVTATPAALERDRFDRKISVVTMTWVNGNDTPGSAAQIMNHEQLTLHDTGDIDWLRFSGPGMLNPRVLVASDLPIDVALFKAADATTPIAANGSTTSFKAYLAVAQDYLLRVKGGQATRYSVVIIGDAINWEEVQYFPWLDFGDPPPFFDMPEETWRIRVQPSLKNILAAPGLELSVKAVGGEAPLGVSEPGPDGRPILDLTGVPTDQPLLFTVKRSGEAPIPLKLGIVRE